MDTLAHASTNDAPEALRLWKSSTKLHKRARRFDFAVALSVSVAAHLLLLLMPDETKPVAASGPSPIKEIEATLFEMPELEQVPVEVDESAPAEAPVAEFAPPMQADLPSIVSVDSFVQPMQPPVASGLEADIGMLTVPTTVPIGQGGNVPRLFEISDLDRVPNLIRGGPLTYPPEFLRSRTEGAVVLRVVLNPAGRVKVAEILESTHPEFSRAAVSAAEHSLYEKPRKGGVPVSASYTLRVSFSLPPG